MIHRLLADADLNGAIVSGVVRRSAYLDFKRAAEVPLKASPINLSWPSPPNREEYL